MVKYGTISIRRDGGEIQRLEARLGQLTIGRDAASFVVLDDAGVAPHHARLICTPGGTRIVDGGSESGTRLNGQPLVAYAGQPLRDGDSISIGPFELRYEVPQQPAIQPEVAAGPASLSDAAPATAGQNGSNRMLVDAGSLRERNPRIPAGVYLPDYDVGDYLALLPPSYHPGSADEFLPRFLRIFKSVLDPLDRMIQLIHYYFDPRVTPEQVLPWLATWVSLVLDEKWDVARRRELVSAAAYLYRFRGTRLGLGEYLRIYAGAAPRLVDAGSAALAGDAPVPEHVVRVILKVPRDRVEEEGRLRAEDTPEGRKFDPAAARQAIERQIRQIIESEKPAHAAYELELSWA
jgi:phage tail-like protein